MLTIHKITPNEIIHGIHKCDFCCKQYNSQALLFKHYKTDSHIKKTDVGSDKILNTASTIWSKYVNREYPLPYEREILYKYFQRNWNEMIGDFDNKRRMEESKFPDYATNEEIEEWYACIVSRELVTREQQIEEVK